MNLIEQLGGYEKASKFCDKEIKDGGYPYGLIDELLEYRRANGIFDVGDKVVLVDNEDRRVFYVDFAGWDTNLSVTGIGKYKDIRGYVWGKDLFRHATDEEIEAGHGL